MTSCFEPVDAFSEPFCSVYLVEHTKSSAELNPVGLDGFCASHVADVVACEQTSKHTETNLCFIAKYIPSVPGFMEYKFSCNLSTSAHYN